MLAATLAGCGSKAADPTTAAPAAQTEAAKGEETKAPETEAKAEEPKVDDANLSEVEKIDQRIRGPVHFRPVQYLCR